MLCINNYKLHYVQIILILERSLVPREVELFFTGYCIDIFSRYKETYYTIYIYKFYSITILALLSINLRKKITNKNIKFKQI